METKAEKSQVIAQKETIDRLTRTVERLERELEKCLNPGKDQDSPSTTTAEHSPKYHRIMRKAKDILRSILGELSPELNHVAQWHKFRNFLLHDEGIDHLRSSKSFKWGLQLVIYTIEGMEEIGREELLDPWIEMHEDLADKFLDACSMGDEGDNISVLTLIECLKILESKTTYYDVRDEDLAELQIDLATISQCQQLALKASKERV